MHEKLEKDIAKLSYSAQNYYCELFCIQDNKLCVTEKRTYVNK